MYRLDGGWQTLVVTVLENMAFGEPSQLQPVETQTKFSNNLFHDKPYFTYLYF